MVISFFEFCINLMSFEFADSDSNKYASSKDSQILNYLYFCISEKEKLFWYVSFCKELIQEAAIII